MLLCKGKKEMGSEASLKLLDLTADATLDDANRAQPSRSTDLHFTINFCADADEDAPLDAAAPLSRPDTQSVAKAISIISRRLHETESALTDAWQVVDSATAVVTAASRRCEEAKQARMNALVAAKSAKTRALLLEIESRRAMQEAVAVAEKARERVGAARQAASEARADADRAREAAGRIEKSEERTAAEMICAEDRLDKAKVRLQELTHTLVETRQRMQMFEKSASVENHAVNAPNALPPGASDRIGASEAVDREASDRQRILSDLLEIEAALDARKKAQQLSMDKGSTFTAVVEPTLERRRPQRLIYPADKRPLLTIDNRAIPVLDLSTDGMRLISDPALARMRIVRGEIAFTDQPPVPVTGKVIRQDDHGLALRLVTRIGNHILDREWRRLNA